MNLRTLFAGLLAVAIVPLTQLQAQNNQGGLAGVNPDPAKVSGTGAGAHFDETLAAQVGSMRFVGKVVVDGSNMPWDPIPVVVMCDGKIRYNVLADNKNGGFSIEATQTASETGRSARDAKKVDPSQFVGCKVSAVLEGFESTTLTIANGSIMDNPDIGTIHLSQDARATGSIVSTTLAAAPSDALAELSKAQSDEMNKNTGSAKRHLQKAVSIDPQLAEAWYHLGKILKEDKPQDALNAFQKAAAADPRYIPPYEYIAELSAVAKKWQDVVDAANHYLQLNPAGNPQIWYWSAMGNFNIGDKELAETAALTALSLDPGHKAAPKTEDELAVIQAARGKYKDALQHVRNCLTYTPPGPEAELIKGQIAQLEKIVPKTAQ